MSANALRYKKVVIEGLADQLDPVTCYRTVRG